MSRKMDSVTNKIKVAQALKNENEVHQLGYSASQMKREIEGEYERSNKVINDPVWKRLNASIEQFGKQRGLHLIIGANGMGTVLYNDSYYDLTTEAIKFVDKHYEEGN